MIRRVLSLAVPLLLGAAGGALSTKPAVAQNLNTAPVGNIAEERNAPYMRSEAGVCHGQTVCEIVLPAVPPGKRLVVKRVNAVVGLATDTLRFTALVAPLNVQFLMLPRAASDGSLAIVNESTLAFFEAGQSPVFRAVLSAEAEGIPILATLSGYLVDVNN